MVPAVPLAADDSAASVAVGGIVLTREPHISMEKERLTIAQDKVTVDFDFLNESDRDITTEVAFPIPSYKLEFSAGGTRSFDDFRLWIDGTELKYAVDSKAFIGDKDVSALVRSYGVDIASLGHYDDRDRKSDFVRLSPAVRKKMAAEGLIDVDEDSGDAQPLWEVRKFYHWTQKFPAHAVVHIRHTYTPAVGFKQMMVEAFDEASAAKYITEHKKDSLDSEMKEDMRQLRDSCVEPSLQKTVFTAGDAARKADPDYGYIGAQWVDYILTTANSWKMPIKDFKLVIDKGPVHDDSVTYVSLCWDGVIKKVDAQHYEAAIADFVPRKELHVLFLTVLKATAATMDSAGAVAPVASRDSNGSSARRPRRWVFVLFALPVGVGVIFGVWFWRRGRSNSKGVTPRQT